MLFASELRSTFLISRRRPALKEFLAEHSEDMDSAERRVRGEQTDWRIVGKHYVREDFLSFVNADKGTNAEALTTKFLEALNNLGLPLDEMRAQGYDGASFMSGHVNGVQARIKQQNRKAVYSLSSPCAKPLHCTLFETTAYQEYEMSM